MALSSQELVSLHVKFGGVRFDAGPFEEKGETPCDRHPLCDEDEETLNHIMLQCRKAQKLVALLFANFGVTWVNHSSVKDMLIGWQGFCTRKKIIKLWMAAPICLFWIVWRERNGAMFENMVPSAQRMKNSFVCALWYWSRNRPEF